MPRVPFFAVVLSLFLAGAGAALHADPAADVAKSSVFGSIDLNSLADGKILIQRGPSGGADRDLSIQSLYIIHAPVARTMDMHKQWDATRHSDLNVYLHHDFSTHPSLGDFTASPPGNSAVRKLAEATEKLPSLEDLQLSKAEAATFKNTGGGGAFPPAVASFWSNLLFHRATAFLQRGLGGQPSYDSVSGSTSPQGEFSRLLKDQPKVRSQFDPLISHSALSGGTGSLPVGPYWELFDVEGQAAFCLGAASSIQTGDSAQLLDMQYYGSGGYYAYLTLYQMWPVMVAGKPATLVWRVDSMSSQELAGLRPMERLGSGSAMMGDIKRVITYFEKDMGH